MSENVCLHKNRYNFCQMHVATIAKLVKAKVCKTFMYRFESGWWLQVRSAPVAQLDRVSGYGPEG